VPKTKFTYDILSYHVRGVLQVDGKSFTIDMDRYGRPEDSYGILLDRAIAEARKTGANVDEIESLAIKRKAGLAAVKILESRLAGE